MEIIIGLTVIIIVAFIIGYASGKKNRPDAEKTIHVTTAPFINPQKKGRKVG